MHWTTALALALFAATGFAACADVEAMNAQTIEEQYGVSAYADSVTTPDGVLTGTLVPITLTSGRQGYLFIPQQTADVQPVYLHDEQGLHPIELKYNVSRAEVARAPGIVEARQESSQPGDKKRSWEKEVLIIGGGAGVGTAIGAIAGGRRGAAVGAAAGGVGALIYDLMTRKKK
jgi:hypothetical protein